jgi:hypothetical protein
VTNSAVLHQIKNTASSSSSKAADDVGLHGAEIMVPDGNHINHFNHFKGCCSNIGLPPHQLQLPHQLQTAFFSWQPQPADDGGSVSVLNDDAVKQKQPPHQLQLPYQLQAAPPSWAPSKPLRFVGEWSLPEYPLVGRFSF